ncbi:divalent-cation tolerance protein CutA [Candidatus Woesearchaeota archaeon]|nr:divalent-cation tolerance protein CutA [Candidatus Woesearchaeota archaeon]
MPYIIIYIPCNSKKQAQTIAKTLLQEHMIACANIFPITSMYWWNKMMQTEHEYVLLVKTKHKLFKKVENRVKQLHSYKYPCIISFKIDQLNKEYANWLEQAV